MKVKRQYTDEEVVRAIERAKGFLTIAAKKMGVTYQAIWNRMQRSEKIRDIVEQIRESHLDFSEIKLLKNITRGDPASIFFHLKCLGKKRGYVERQELAGVFGSPLVLIQEKELSEMTPELATQKYLELIKSVEVNVLENNVINKQLQLKENNQDNKANKFKRK